MHTHTQTQIHTYSHTRTMRTRVHAVQYLFTQLCTYTDCLFKQYIYRCVRTHTHTQTYLAVICVFVCVCAHVCVCVREQCDSRQTQKTHPEQTLNKEIDAFQHPVNDHQWRAITPEDCLSTAPTVTHCLLPISSSLSIYIYIYTHTHSINTFTTVLYLYSLLPNYLLHYTATVSIYSSVQRQYLSTLWLPNHLQGFVSTASIHPLLHHYL